MKFARLPAAITVAILLLFCLGCPPPKPVWVDIVVCAESHVLPTKNCPATAVLPFEKGHEPHDTCPLHPAGRTKVCNDTGKRAALACPDVHEVPTYEAPEFWCLRHARNPLAQPLIVVAWLDGQVKVHRMTDVQLDEGTAALGHAGTGYLRIFYPGWLDGDDCVLPYLREPDGRFNLDKPNPAYDVNLKRLAIALQRYEIGLYVDMADQCGARSEWDFYYHNVNGVHGWWDESDVALEYWKAAVVRVLGDVGGPEGNLIGFGNELAPTDDPHELAYILKWGGRRLDYLKSLGVRTPIPFSGGGEWAHKMLGYLSAEDGYYPDYRQVALVVHGIGLVTHTPQGFESLGAFLLNLSSKRPYGFSKDGVSTQGPGGWNWVPAEFAGTCDQAGGCDSNIAETIKLLQMYAHLVNDGFYVWEMLPREISFNELLHQISALSLDMIWQVPLAVFGVDLRRNFQ